MLEWAYMDTIFVGFVAGYFVAGHFVAGRFVALMSSQGYFFAQIYIKLDFQLSKKFNNGIHKFLRYATK
jgi:hypothetical protein